MNSLANLKFEVSSFLIFDGSAIYSLTHAHEPKQLPHTAHEFVTAIRVEVLIRAGAGDDGDAVGFAHIHSRLGDACHILGKTGFDAHHAVHPHMFYAEVHALLHDLVGHFGVGEDEDPVGSLGQRL